MLGIMRGIWAPEWKYITEPSRPHPPNFISNLHWTRSSKTTDLDLKKTKQNIRNNLNMHTGDSKEIVSMHIPGCI